MTIPGRVYHYTKRETAIECILPEKTIRLGPLGLTNDPRETQPWLGGISYGPGRDLPPDRDYLWKAVSELNRARKEDWFVICLCQDDPKLSLPQPAERYEACFQHGCARARSWAQYAQNHQGVCLEFDGPSLDDAIVRAAAGKNAAVFRGAVSYGDELNLGSVASEGSAPFHFSYPELTAEQDIEAGVRAHILKHYRTLFLEKSADWSSEFEFRWLVNSPRGGPFDVDISGALLSVIIGVEFPLVYAPTLRQLCNGLDAKIEKMYWQDRTPRKELLCDSHRDNNVGSPIPTE